MANAEGLPRERGADVSPRVSDAAWRRELRATVALGLPLIAAQLAQIAINATDTLMMGWLGPEALAAGALGTTLLFLFIIVGIGLAAGVGTLVAQERGVRAHGVREVRRTVRQGVWAVTIFSGLALLMLAGGERLLLLAGQEPALASAAMDYLRPAMWAVPFACWFVVLRAFVQALERPRPILVVTLVAIAVNAGLNWVLMFGRLGMPALGIAGTGVATVLSNALMLALLGAHVARDRRMRRYRLLGRLWRPDPARLLAVFRLGAPIAALLVAEVGAFSGSTALAGMVGAQTLAAHAIALQVASVTFMIPLGLSQATNVRVGLAFGRGSGVALAGHVSLALGLGVAALAAIVMLTAPGVLVSAFIDVETARATHALAVSFLFLAALFQLVDAGQVVYAAALRGMGDTSVPLAIGLLGYWVVGLPLGAALAFGWLGPALGGLGVWIGLASGLTVVCALLAWRWHALLAAMRARRDGVGAVPPRGESL